MSSDDELKITSTVKPENKHKKVQTKRKVQKPSKKKQKKKRQKKTKTETPPPAPLPLPLPPPPPPPTPPNSPTVDDLLPECVRLPLLRQVALGNLAYPSEEAYCSSRNNYSTCEVHLAKSKNSGKKGL